MEAAWGFPQWILTSTFKRVVKWLLKRQAAKVTPSAGMRALFGGIRHPETVHTRFTKVCTSPSCTVTGAARHAVSSATMLPPRQQLSKHVLLHLCWGWPSCCHALGHEGPAVLDDRMCMLIPIHSLASCAEQPGGVQWG